MFSVSKVILLCKFLLGIIDMKLLAFKLIWFQGLSAKQVGVLYPIKVDFMNIMLLDNILNTKIVFYLLGKEADM